MADFGITKVKPTCSTGVLTALDGVLTALDGVSVVLGKFPTDTPDLASESV
jgi:hypothetical protein